MVSQQIPAWPPTLRCGFQERSTLRWWRKIARSAAILQRELPCLPGKRVCGDLMASSGAAQATVAGGVASAGGKKLVRRVWLPHPVDVWCLGSVTPATAHKAEGVVEVEPDDGGEVRHRSMMPQAAWDP